MLISTDDPELLIEEARSRQRRRRLRTAAVLAAVLGVGAAVWVVLGHGSAATSATGSSGTASATARCPGTDLGTLAYVRAGALDVVDFAQCRPTTLVRRGVAGTPAFSHDGTFVSVDRGYVATAGGVLHTVASRPVWSPVANVFAFVTKSGGLELMSPGNDVRRLLPEGFGASAPLYAPDGKSVAFVRGMQIWSVDVATGKARRLADARPGQPLPVGFSPNGRWFVYREYPNSASLAADGMALMALEVRTGRTVAVASSIGRSDFVTWCGNTLAYVANHGGRMVTNGDGIAIASAPSWQPQLVLASGGKTSWNALGCSGGSLVVSAGPTSLDSPFGQERRSLFVVPAKVHATPKLLTATTPPAHQTDELPMWSTDRKWLVFVRTTPGGIAAKGSLYAYDLAVHKLVGPVAAVGGTGNYYGSYGWASQIAWYRPGV